MKHDKGFTLVELIITMAIMVFVIALSGPVYTSILTGVKDSAIKDQMYDELIRNFELIRLDLEHVGLGIGRDETTMPIIWNEVNRTLTLHSVLNNSNDTTMGWGILDCATTAQDITAATYVVNLKDTPNLQSMVLLDQAKDFAGLATPANYKCPAAIGIYTAYPYDSTATDACNIGFCNSVTYVPSANHGVPAKKASCAQGTFDLLRRVGAAPGDPIVNCVADFRVRFDVDTNGNNLIGLGESELNAVPSPATAGTLMDQVKNVEVVMLVQAGQFDEDINTAPNGMVSGVDLSAALGGVTNASNYRWKTIKISGKAMSW